MDSSSELLKKLIQLCVELIINIDRKEYDNSYNIIEKIRNILVEQGHDL